MPEREVEWLMPGFLPRRFATLLYGPSQGGKSTLERWITTCLTRGWPLPGAEPFRCEAVIWIGAEEPPDCVVKPQLRRMGADLSRVWFPDWLVNGEREPFRFPEHRQRLLDVIGDHKAGLVVIDKVKANIDADLKPNSPDTGMLVCGCLQDVAHQGDAGLLMGGHPKKGKEGGADQAFAGGMEWFNVPRQVNRLVRNPNAPAERILIAQKPSLGGVVPAQHWILVAEGDGIRLHPLKTSDTTADDVDDEDAGPGQASKFNQCKESLRWLLKQDKQEWAWLFSYFKARDIGSRTVQRALKAMDAVPSRDGQGKEHKGYWERPQGDHPEWQYPKEDAPAA